MSKDAVNGGLRVREVKRFGWVPDIPDARDFMFSAPEAVLTALPKKVNLTSKMPPVYDQGQLGSCTANAIGAAFEYEQVQQKQKDFMPSRLFIYYNERAIEGTVDSDSGAMIRDGIKCAAKLGVCSEDTWPYDVARFIEKPPAKAYTEAKKHQVVAYRRVIAERCTRCRAAWRRGIPFVFGFTVYESFDSPGGRKDGRGADAATRRAGARRSRGARGRLRRRDASASSCAIPGGQPGGKRGISRCPMAI